jgi:hypothetical protein
MSRLTSRLARVRTVLPPPPPAPRSYDPSRLTPDQRMRLAELSARCETVGPNELSADELEEIAHLVGILEREAGS